MSAGSSLLDLVPTAPPRSEEEKKADREFEEKLAKEFDMTLTMVETLKKTVAPPEATPADIAMFLATCKRLNLDPFTKQIYLLSFAKRGKLSICIGVDGMRSLAEQTGQYDGQDAPIYEFDPASRKLRSATVKVYRKGMGRPICATAAWDEWSWKVEANGNWARQPRHMLGIAAERIALRKAFPRTLSGLYDPEELEVMDGHARRIPAPKELSIPQLGAPTSPISVDPSERAGPPISDVPRERIPETVRGQATKLLESKGETVEATVAPLGGSGGPSRGIEVTNPPAHPTSGNDDIDAILGETVDLVVHEVDSSKPRSAQPDAPEVSKVEATPESAGGSPGPGTSTSSDASREGDVTSIVAPPPTENAPGASPTKPQSPPLKPEDDDL
jgi:phage recombination protein Bet